LGLVPSRTANLVGEGESNLSETLQMHEEARLFSESRVTGAQGLQEEFTLFDGAFPEVEAGTAAEGRCENRRLGRALDGVRARARRLSGSAMPHFDPEDARALASENLDVDARVDLRGLGAVEALALVEAALARHAGAEEARVLFAFDPATPGGGETLFLPVGRRLKTAIAEGVAVRAMPAAGGGWIVRLAARPTDGGARTD
jgi:hypothetical protein